jgi:hypothetical protein
MAMVAEMPPPCGIVHAAGVLDDGVLSQQTWPRFEIGRARPKVMGGFNPPGDRGDAAGLLRDVRIHGGCWPGQAPRGGERVP